MLRGKAIALLNSAWLTTFLILSLFCPAWAAPGSWSQEADMPAHGSATAACVVDGILYVIGGNYPWPQPLHTVWAYDPKTDSWMRKSDMPTPRNALAAAAVDGVIYVMGGIPGGVGVNTVEAYDPKTDSWATKASMATGRGALAACAVDGIIYAIGGTSSWPDRLSTVEAYDSRTDRWSKKSNLPTGVVFPTASAANGIIYVFMGTNTFAYDPKNDRWTMKARFSPWSYGLMSGTVDGIIYLFGGMTEDLHGSYDFVLAYDPAQDRFSSKRKMPRTNVGAACGVISEKVYIAAGVSKEPAVNPDEVYYTSLDIFDPQGGVTPKILSTALESTNRWRLAWQAETGIKYGLESTPELLTNRWIRVSLPSGSTVTATNNLVETHLPFFLSEPSRFFRVFETNE